MADTPAHLAALPRVAEAALTPDQLDEALRDASEPFVVRGLARDWPLVRAGLDSGAAARAYLASQARDRTFPASLANHGGDERLFYDEAMAMNFRMAQAPFEDWLAALDRAEADPAAPTVYLSSIDIDGYFGGLGAANALPLGDRRALARAVQEKDERIFLAGLDGLGREQPVAERATIGGADQALVGPRSTGERALFMAEQFAFEQPGWNRGTIQGDEREIPARTHFMERPGDQFFACAGFSGDQDGASALGDQ